MKHVCVWMFKLMEIQKDYSALKIKQKIEQLMLCWSMFNNQLSRKKMKEALIQNMWWCLRCKHSHSRGFTLQAPGLWAQISGESCIMCSNRSSAASLGIVLASDCVSIVTLTDERRISTLEWGPLGVSPGWLLPGPVNSGKANHFALILSPY